MENDQEPLHSMITGVFQDLLFAPYLFERLTIGA